MAADRRLTILLTPAEYDELKRRAGLVPVSTWIRHQVLRVRDEAGEPENLRRDAVVPVAPGSASVVERPIEPSSNVRVMPPSPKATKTPYKKKDKKERPDRSGTHMWKGILMCRHNIAAAACQTCRSLENA